MEYLISLVIPTNGVVEWVFPVLNSIYCQSIDENLFEVIVVDNGSNIEFESLMIDFANNHKNLIYKKTTATLFQNQIEGFRLASGEFIKFVNHRTILIEGSLLNLIDFVEKNRIEKPITYFLNNTSEISTPENYLSSFDSFIYGLGKYSSWSGGVSCWREDLDDILGHVELNSNDLFPHLIFVFYFKKDRRYQIDNSTLWREISTSSVKKGKYDVFYAFGIQFVEAINKLYLQNKISSETREFVLDENEKFVAQIYLTHIILKKPCSYDLSTSKDSLNYYYGLKKIQKLALENLMCRIKSKIFRGGNDFGREE
ncbi:TPA: glycosyltransferase, partial [Streptococcus suis]